MYDYMRALQQIFTTPPERELSRELEQAHAELHEKLDHQERKLLLRICDLHEAVLDKVSLHSFISGYRLAEGIGRELSIRPPYSFDCAEEQRGEEMMLREEE